MANTKEAEKDCTVPLSDPRKLKGAGKKAWPLSWVVPLVSSRRPPAVTVAVPSRVRLAPEKPEKTNWSSLALTASTRLKPWNSRIWRRKESAIFMKGAMPGLFSNNVTGHVNESSKRDQQGPILMGLKWAGLEPKIIYKENSVGHIGLGVIIPTPPASKPIPPRRRLICFAGRRLLAGYLPIRRRLGQGVARQGRGWPRGHARGGGARRRRNGGCMGFLRLRGLELVISRQVQADLMTDINCSDRSHLPDKMSGVIVPKLFPDHGYCATYGSTPSLCIIASKLEFRVAGVNSGSGASPSRYCMTCRMIGLAPGIGCEHISPSACLIDVVDAVQLRVHCLWQRTPVPVLENPVNQHLSAVVRTVADRPPATGDLKKERAEGEHVGERGCLSCACQLWGYESHGSNQEHVACFDVTVDDNLVPLLMEVE
uniref:Uncharacterized protein n=1 Tax=Oryza rufipogon TaxID=4529 RepID=A0A0E0Q3N2_ORYRU